MLLKYTFINLIYIFIICSFMGWFIEVSSIYIIFHKIVKRGILFSPLCSIYGFGGILLYFLSIKFPKLKKNIFALYISSAIILGLFELLSGLFFKYTLNIEMWNYDGQFLEILNYTTVPLLMFWGLLGSIYIYLIQPRLLRAINNIETKYKNTIAIIFLILYLIDLFFSITTILNNPKILDILIYI